MNLPVHIEIIIVLFLWYFSEPLPVDIPLGDLKKKLEAMYGQKDITFEVTKKEYKCHTKRIVIKYDGTDGYGDKPDCVSYYRLTAQCTVIIENRH